MAEAISEGQHARPGGPLTGLVAGYDGYRQRGVAPGRHLGLPSPYVTLIVALDEPMHVSGGCFEALIGGLHPTPVIVTHDGAQSGVQLTIDPLASRALFGLPAGELAGLDLHADAVIGRVASELTERVRLAADWSGRFAELDRALIRQISVAGEVAVGTPPPVSAAWARLKTSGGAVPIAALAREVGWSERQLEKAFSREIGMSPKQAARVIRFDRARRALQSRAVGTATWGETGAVDGRLDLARLAADHGYHDQSHLIRDFRAFTGLAPTRWLAQEFGNVQVSAAEAA